MVAHDRTGGDACAGSMLLEYINTKAAWRACGSRQSVSRDISTQSYPDFQEIDA
jgi:hypothetical protein